MSRHLRRRHKGIKIMDNLLLLAFGVYALFFGAITYMFHLQNTASDNFLLGNRSLNYVATAIVAHSSDMSLWLFMGFPGIVYMIGTSSIWIPIGLLAGMWATWNIIAKRLRVETEHYNSVTLSDYLTKKFNDTSGLIRLFSACAALLFFIVYISSGLVGIGLMCHEVFGLNYIIGTLIGLATTILYTYFGGFMGIAWCHLIQGIFLVFMIFFVPLYAYTFLENGWTTITTIATLKNISLSIFPHSLSELYAGIITALAWGLGYFGQPHILISFMGINKSEDMKKAQYVGMIWQIITLAGAILIGLIGIGLFKNGLANSELVFIRMIETLFSPFVSGLILAAIVAAGLTTINTQILVAGSILSEDLYKEYWNTHASTSTLLAVSKIGVVLVPTLSCIIAITYQSSVLHLVHFAWSGLGCTFGPLLILALLQKKLHYEVAFVGMLSGALIVLGWPLTHSTFPAMIPGFLGSLCIMLVLDYLVSLRK